MVKIRKKLKSALFVLNTMLKWKKEIPIVHEREDGQLLKGNVASDLQLPRNSLIAAAKLF